MFRDESNHVIKKATNTRSRASRLTSQPAQRPSIAPTVAITQPTPSSLGTGAAAQTSARSSPSVAQMLLHPQQRPVPSPAPSSPRSITSLRTSHEPEARGRRQNKLRRSQRPGVYEHSPLLGILTPRSGHISSANSEDSPSDE